MDFCCEFATVLLKENEVPKFKLRTAYPENPKNNSSPNLSPHELHSALLYWLPPELRHEKR